MSACHGDTSQTEPKLSDLYDTLDKEINKSSEYDRMKLKKVDDLKADMAKCRDERERTFIINRLIDEFVAFNADSTLRYIGINLNRPAVKSIPGEYTKLNLKRADVYAHAGLFSEALDILQSVPRDSLSDNLLEDYYSTYCGLYQYLCEYSDEHETSKAHERQRALYADSLSRVVKPGSFNYMIFVETENARNGKAQSAIDSLSMHLAEYQPGTRSYSIIVSTLAYIYKTTGQMDDYKHYLVLSAISDVKGAVKENVSFREVATVMFEEGDVERANHYLKKSISDANFFSAMMRNAQSSKMLPVIDGAYTAMKDKLNTRLKIMVIVSCILSLILVFAIIFVLKQYKNLHRANDRIKRANIELRRLSDTLRDTNAELEKKNIELRESDLTKEQYAGLFMEYCSTAISTLQQFQRSIRVLVAKGANRNNLTSRLESSEVIDELLSNFYLKFDEAILNIYPSFVEKFNALLTEDGKVVLKPGELLNTELRVYALIRLGIDDSAKIASFLRCSISTVYTYRSKMKKRAINPNGLENEVRNLVF